ncbi:glycoside hydrolase family protein [Nocardioides marmoraquaticus]
MPVLDLPLPSADDTIVVVPAPGSGPGNWSGAASAVLVDGEFWLAYRVRRPLTEGRGVETVVARSGDGVHFETVCAVHRDAFGAESFERPVLVRRPEDGWRLYLSCATPGSKHWWIEALDAGDPADLPGGRRTVVLPGDERVAVKDPVVTVGPERGWEMWLCEHPLTDAGHEDRMSTSYLTSDDGLAWTRHGTVLGPRAGAWDARGARVTTVLSHDPLVVLYDGRATAADNWHETTGVARAGVDGRLVADDDAGVLRSPDSDGALRYAAAVPLPDGSVRFFHELARPDGAHDLVTSLSAAAR